MNTHQDNAQESNAVAPKPTPHDPKMACNGLASPGPQETAEGPVITSTGLTSPAPERSCNGLSESPPVDPHEVRARLTRRGSLNGLELDGGTGVVFIPQHALPDLRRRLLLAQERFTAMSGPVPGKRRKRRPASAR